LQTRINIQCAELTSNQIPPLALMQAFHGCGFGDDQGYVPVVDSHSKKYCTISGRLYQLVSLDQLQ